MEQEIKLKIRDLENIRANAINNKEINSIKGEKTRKFLVGNIIGSLVGYIAGIFISPVISSVALLYNCLNVIILGPVVFYFEVKEEKFDKEIKKCDEEIQNLTKQINTSNIEQIPVVEENNSIKSIKENDIKQNKKQSKKNKKL